MWSLVWNGNRWVRHALVLDHVEALAAAIEVLQRTGGDRESIRQPQFFAYASRAKELAILTTCGFRLEKRGALGAMRKRVGRGQTNASSNVENVRTLEVDAFQQARIEEPPIHRGAMLGGQLRPVFKINIGHC